MCKKLAMVFLGLLAMSVVNVPVFAADRSDVQKLIGRLENRPRGFYEYLVRDYNQVKEVERRFSNAFQMPAAEKKSSLYDFHIAGIRLLQDQEGETIISENALYIQVQQYEELLLPNHRQRVHWRLHDLNGDGVVDRWIREFNLQLKTDGVGWANMDVNFPEGFRNKEWGGKEWNNQPPKEAQETFNKAVKFWLLEMSPKTSI